MSLQYNINFKKGVNIITINGNLIEEGQTPQLIKDVEQAIKEGKLQFIVDLSELQHMNSTGLNALVNILTKARKADGEVIVTNVPDRVNKLLIITKLNTVFTVCNSIQDAMNQMEMQTTD